MSRLAQRRGSPRGHARPQPWQVALFGGLPAIALGVVFFSELRWAHSLGNFTTFRTASLAVLHGHSPFVAPGTGAFVHNDRFVYPPVTGLLFAPFAVLPLELARVLMLVSATACVVVALRLLGVRDWRCYGVALLGAPVTGSVSIGALSTFLLLGAALAWRLRDRPAATAAAAAVTAVSKLFLWPLWVWLLATRRRRAAALSAGIAVALVAAGWAVIGFAGLAEYPRLLHALGEAEAPQSYSLAGLLGLTGPAGLVVSIVLALAVVLATFAAARGEDGDRRAFSIAVAGALVATPVLWLHYFVLLLVPIALYRPRLSALWFAPLALWLTPYAHSDGSAWKASFALLLAAAVVARAVATAPRPGSAARTAPRTAPRLGGPPAEPARTA